MFKNYRNMDPHLLYSLVNTRLRDKNSSLQDFCEEQAVPLEELVARLWAAGFEYFPEINQFRTRP